MVDLAFMVDLAGMVDLFCMVDLSCMVDLACMVELACMVDLACMADILLYLFGTRTGTFFHFASFIPLFFSCVRFVSLAEIPVSLLSKTNPPFGFKAKIVSLPILHCFA
jgi:hypothetical protein